MPSKANRKIISPSGFQDSRGGQAERSGVLPADQASPEQEYNPHNAPGEKGN